MKQLRSRYDSLWRDAEACWSRGEVEPDVRLLDPGDDRFGLIVIARPDLAFLHRLDAVLTTLREAEPSCYVYPASDVHFTVLAIVSCRSGFALESVDIAAYANVVAESVHGVPAFSIDVSGVSAFSGGVILQGFPAGDALLQLRNRLRAGFASAPLMNSIDSRYSIETAHSTVIRFPQQLRDPVAFLERLREFRETEFGKVSVAEVELVFADWYQRRRNTRTLATFRLGDPALVPPLH